MTIYIDVLLAVNLYINYFLVRGTSLLLRIEISARRCLLSAAVGAMFSLFVLAPELPFAASTAIKLISGVIIVFVAFGKSKRADFVIRMLCFLLISFVYAGAMLALWVFVAPFGMFYRNGIAYFDIPIIAVALLTIMSYGAVWVVRTFIDRKNLSTMRAEITISMAAGSVSLIGIADTGNNLCDPFNGKPVIICRSEVIQDIAPENIRCYLEGKTEAIDSIRLVPCHTIAGSTLVPVFTAKVSVNGRRADAAIGVTTQLLGADCIFNPKLLSI